MARNSILGRFPIQSNPADNKKAAVSAASIIKPLQELTVNTPDKALTAQGLVNKSTGTSASTSKPRKRLSPTELESLSSRQRARLIKEQHSAYLEHPYTVKMHTAKSKLLHLMGKIFDIADNDLLVCDFDTGLNDYTKNLKFADDLDSISKELAVLSNDCTNKANAIRDKIDQAKEDKRLIQDVVYLTEIVKESEKCPEIRLMRPDENYVPKAYVPTSSFRVKRERPPPVLYISSDSETETTRAKKKKKKVTPPSGDPDTKFAYAKGNDFDELRHPNSICILCDKVCRDQTELRNHMSNHHKELFRCLRCGNLSRTQLSFKQHMKTHTSDRFTCNVCMMTFDRKTTLSNHAQKHSGEKLVCKKCGKDFIYRGGFLEHIKYRHTDKPTVQCPVCKKMFWMPTGMRSHRRKLHGRVRELVYKQ